MLLDQELLNTLTAQGHNLEYLPGSGTAVFAMKDGVWEPLREEEILKI